MHLRYCFSNFFRQWSLSFVSLENKFKICMLFNNNDGLLFQDCKNKLFMEFKLLFMKSKALFMDSNEIDTLFLKCKLENK